MFWRKCLRLLPPINQPWTFVTAREIRIVIRHENVFVDGTVADHQIVVLLQGCITSFSGYAIVTAEAHASANYIRRSVRVSFDECSLTQVTLG